MTLIRRRGAKTFNDLPTRLQTEECLERFNAEEMLDRKEIVESRAFAQLQTAPALLAQPGPFSGRPLTKAMLQP